MSNENHPITALPFCRKAETLDKAQLALEAVSVQDERPKPRSNRARDAQTR